MATLVSIMTMNKRNSPPHIVLLLHHIAIVCQCVCAQDASAFIRAEVKTLPDTPHTFWLFHPWFEPTVNHVVGFLDAVFKIHR